MESYSLTYYFAARHTKIDSFLKRHKKGVLITIGDDCCNKTISERVGKELFGNFEGEVTTTQILDEARQQWDIYHISLSDGMGNSPRIIEPWKELLGEHVIKTEDSYGKDIPDLIAGIVLRSYNESNDDEMLMSNEEDED